MYRYSNWSVNPALSANLRGCMKINKWIDEIKKRMYCWLYIASMESTKILDKVGVVSISYGAGSIDIIYDSTWHGGLCTS